jgi:hypothetical protein
MSKSGDNVSISHSSQKVETIQMLVDGVTYEQNVVYKHNVMVLNLKKE